MRLRRKRWAQIASRWWNLLRADLPLRCPFSCVLIVGTDNCSQLTCSSSPTPSKRPLLRRPCPLSQKLYFTWPKKLRSGSGIFTPEVKGSR